MGVRPFSRFSRRGSPIPSAAELLPLCGWRSNLHFQNLPRIHGDRPGFAERAGAETAPAPKLRRLNQSALHWIPMHVAKFLDPLAFAPNIEIVESLLPDVL